MISAAEVAKIAYHKGVGDRVIEKDYVLSWLLVAIAESGLGHKLAFKGGTALKKCYYPDYRFSEDLDFTLDIQLSHEDLVTTFETLFPWLEQRVNLALTLKSAELSIFDSTTILVNYIGPLKARMESRHLKVDFTRGELLLEEPTERFLIAPYSDYPSGTALPTYTLEEILTEKLCALMGRTEPRDLYDIYWLLEEGDVELTFMTANFAAKCRHKGLNPLRFGEALAGKEKVFGKLWNTRLAVQVQDLPFLDEVLRKVRRHLRSLGLIEGL